MNEWHRKCVTKKLIHVSKYTHMYLVDMYYLHTVCTYGPSYTYILKYNKKAEIKGIML